MRTTNDVKMISYGGMTKAAMKKSETATKAATTRNACNARAAHAGTRPSSGLPPIGGAMRVINVTTRSASRSDPDLDRGLPSNRISCAHTKTGQKPAASAEQKLLRACASEQGAQGGLRADSGSQGGWAVAYRF